MSKIGKKPIILPEGVEVKIGAEEVLIKGLKGELSVRIFSGFKVGLEGGELRVIPPEKTQKQTNALWGTFKALLKNAVLGVTTGYEKQLEFEGIGFKVAIEGENLVLSLGFSHPVKLAIPKGIKITVNKNIITVSGIDKDLVGRTASQIRALKKPEPYKGKGIRYLGEVIRRKAGKKAATTTA